MQAQKNGEKKGETGKQNIEKELGALKERYSVIIERISGGTVVPIEQIYKIKRAAEGEKVFCTEGEKRFEVPQGFCADIYEKIVNAMFEGGDIGGLGALGEDDLLVAAAHGHEKVETAIAAATIIALRDPVRKEDLEFLLLSKHEKIRKMMADRYFVDDIEIERG